MSVDTTPYNLSDTEGDKLVKKDIPEKDELPVEIDITDRSMSHTLIGVVNPCTDYPRGKVVKVYSGNLIEVKCGDSEVLVQYLGVDLKTEHMERSKSLNEHMVFEKLVHLVIYQITNEAIEGKDILIAEVFNRGESVNLRLIQSGLVTLGEMGTNFHRTDKFQQAFQDSTDGILGDWDNFDKKIIEKGSAGQPFGCGTLPCRN